MYRCEKYIKCRRKKDDWCVLEFIEQPGFRIRCLRSLKIKGDPATYDYVPFTFQDRMELALRKNR